MTDWYNRRAMRARFVVAGVGLTLTVVAGCASGGLLRTTLVEPHGVRFQIAAPTAGQVAVAGTFNGWSTTANPMHRTEGASGFWSAMIVLPAGEHQFMFVVDGGTWVVPPQADGYVDDGFGARNGVVVVQRTDEEP